MSMGQYLPFISLAEQLSDQLLPLLPWLSSALMGGASGSPGPSAGLGGEGALSHELLLSQAVCGLNVLPGCL